MTVNIIDDKMYVLIPDDGMVLFNEIENVYSDSVYTGKEDDIWSWVEIEFEDEEIERFKNDNGSN